MDLCLIDEGGHWKKSKFGEVKKHKYCTHIKDLQEWCQSEGDYFPKLARPREFNEAWLGPLDRKMEYLSTTITI